jgi:hypothetical protein
VRLSTIVSVFSAMGSRAPYFSSPSAFFHSEPA